MEYKFDECVRGNLCVDCDNKRCLFSGSKIADCPKYHCDNDRYEDCDHCKFWDEWAAKERENYV